MESIDKVAEWMGELGPQLDLEEVARSQAGHLWFLARDEATVVEAEYLPDSDQLFLASELAPAGADPASLYECALQFNFLWKDTGLVLALDGPGGRFVLQHECSAAALDAESLRERIAGLLQQTDAWREVIAAHASPAAGEQDPISLQGGIRV